MESMKTGEPGQILTTDRNGKPICITPKKLHTQVWEDCHCGNSPIYLSHGCCAKCAR